MRNNLIYKILKNTKGTIFVMCNSINYFEKAILENKNADFKLFFNNNDQFHEKSNIFEKNKNIETFFLTSKKEINYYIYKNKIKKIDLLFLELEDNFQHSLNLLIKTEYIDLVNKIVFKDSNTNLFNKYVDLSKSHKKMFYSLKKFSIWKLI